jgi:hypothetical protein
VCFSRAEVELIDHLAGFDNFGSRHDIAIVFEIEREVGDFYRGWDDEALEEGDPSLPPAVYDLDGQDQKPDEAEDKAGMTHRVLQELQAQQGQDSALDRQEAMGSRTQSPDQVDSPWNRRKSMPSVPPIPQTIPAIIRPRRNSSIQEPSPLARLFLRDLEGDDRAAKMRERRQSLVSLAMPTSQSQPSLSSVLSPIRRRQLKESRLSLSGIPTQSGAGWASAVEPRPRGLHLAKPSIAPIEEGKKMSFAAPPEQAPIAETPRLGSMISPRMEKFPGGVPFPTSRGIIPSGAGEASGEAGSIGRASDIEAAADQGLEGGQGLEVVSDMRDRLDAIDERQRRIEGMLESLLARADGYRSGSRGVDDVFDET